MTPNGVPHNDDGSRNGSDTFQVVLNLIREREEFPVTLARYFRSSVAEVTVAHLQAEAPMPSMCCSVGIRRVSKRGRRLIKCR